MKPVPLDRPHSGRKHATRNAYTTRFTPREKNRDRLLLEAAITRGYRHQVRAHLATLGLPILGDPLYGLTQGGVERMALHAFHLQFHHPDTGKPLVVESDLFESPIA